MEEIRNWWEVPSIAHFCSLFRAAFGLTDFEIEDLEDALIIDGSNEDGNNRFLADLHARLLRGLYRIKDITAENFEPYLSQVLKIRWEDELGRKNPLADRDYSKLTTREKVEILHNLCDFRLDLTDVPDLLKGLDADSLRVEPLGFDAEGRTFWYFYGTRLYREEKPPQTDNKANKKSKKKKKQELKNKKKKGKVKKKKRTKGSSSESDDTSESSEHPSSDYSDDDDDNEEEQDEGSDDKEDQEKKDRPLWTVVCSTEEEWQQLAESFKKSKHKDEKMLYETLSVDFVPEIGKMIEAKDKALRKKLLMEMAPRRASDRIASKVQVREDEEQQEENERQREKERLAEERKRLEEERQREKQQQAERRQQERARRARMREERQWLMANGKFVPEELKVGLGKEEEAVENETERRPNSRSKQVNEEVGLEDRDEDLYTGMYKVLDTLKKHNNAWPFLEPVEESYAPQYYEIIEEPMDLSTIEQKLDDSKYKSLSEFSADMKLMFENCLEYNGSDSMYTKMANTLEAAFNRQLKKHFPEDDDNSDEDFEEELARKSRKDKKRRGEGVVGAETYRSTPQTDERPFAPKMAAPGMQSMFPNHMMPNSMANGGMMPSPHPSRMPFPGPPHFAPDGRPLYPPQFYQNAFNPAAYGGFRMSQPGPQLERFRYPQGNPIRQMTQPPQSSHFQPQRMPGRMPFSYGVPGSGGSMKAGFRENDVNSPGHMEQTKQMSPQQTAPVSTSGEPTPPSVTGGTERGRQPQQPHGAAPYYRPQSFNQAFLGYPRNGGMPYGAPGTGAYSQLMAPGREPWRLDRGTPEGVPQRVPSNEGPFHEEGKPRNMPELQPKDKVPNFIGSRQSGDNTGSSEGDDEQEEPQDCKPSGRGEQSTETTQQPKARVPATLSISHILSGASRGDQQHQGEATTLNAPQVTQGMPPVSARQLMRSPENKDQLTAAGEDFNKLPGKASHEGTAVRGGYESVHDRQPHGVTPKQSIEKGGPYGGHRHQEAYEQMFGAKLNDSKHLGNVAESVIKKTPQSTAPELNSYNKIHARETSESKSEETLERKMKTASENGHLDPAKTDIVGHRIPDTMSRRGKESNQRETASFKSWSDLQLDSVSPGGFLQELNDVGPPSAVGVEKTAPDKNNRLPFTSLLRGITPSPGPPSEGRGQFLNLDASNRERRRESMLMGNYLHNPEETPERYNPSARSGDMSAYMYGNKRPSDMMPPALQYRPNLSSMAHQRNMESAEMQSRGNSQFVDLNSVHYRGFPTGLPGSRESLSREQLYFLEQQRRQQIAAASSMDAMMAGAQPERIMGFSGMLRQQELFNAAYASHMRNGEFPSYPSEEIPAKMARFS